MHGFEYQPFEDVTDLQRDTPLVVTRTKRFGLREQSWYGGDIHNHPIRHQPCGHAAVQGVVRYFSDLSWCSPRLTADPTLTMIHEEWSPGFGQAMCLAQPCTGGEFFNDESGKPGIGC